MHSNDVYSDDNENNWIEAKIYFALEIPRKNDILVLL